MSKSFFFKGVGGELKKKKSVSTFLTAINAKKVWIRLTKKFNLKHSSKKKKMDWLIWNRLRRNITVYANSPKVERFSSSPGSSKSYRI